MDLFMSETGSLAVYQDHPLFRSLWLCDSMRCLWEDI